MKNIMNSINEEVNLGASDDEPDEFDSEFNKED